MYKVMIVEDEYFERESIKLLLSQYFGDKVEVIYEATNGNDAIDKIFHEKPDIILFDIHMPKLDGLSAAEIIKENCPNVEMLILTANSRFEYAKKAINIGVNDFLVKPYSDETFEKAINTVLDKINKSRFKEQKYKKIEENVHKVKDVLERELFDIIINNFDYEDELLQNYIELLNIKEQKYCILSVKALRTLNNELVTNEIKSYFSTVCSQIFGSEYLGKNIFICFPNDQYQFEYKLKNIAELYKDRAIKLYYARSEYQTDLTRIKQSYLSTENKLQEEIKEYKINNFSYPFKDEEKLYKKIFDCDKDESLKVLAKIFDHFLKQNVYELDFEMKKFIKQIVLLIDRLLNQNLTEARTYLKTDDLLNEINREQDHKKIRLILEKYITESIDQLNNERHSKKNKFIEIAKHYIELNYEKNISLNEVADYVGMSSYHLSKSFKKETGVNFKEYLTNVKIEQSKKMMLTGDHNITEIAYSMGFNDPGYFSTSFKKNTGMTPKEFIKKYRTL